MSNRAYAIYPYDPPQVIAAKEQGASALEFIITAPAVLLALLGILQAALLYQARSQFEVATQEAVRAGTLHGARIEFIREALARGLTPLYTHDQNLAALAQGYAAAKVAAGQASIRILSPTREAFDDFAEMTRDSTGAWARAIPVDHLGYRQTRVGGASKLSVQDATLLKIQITAVQPLVVPFIDQLGHGLYRLDQGLGNLGIPRFFGVPLRPVVGIDGRTRWGIPLQAEAIMRMQSPVLAEGLPTQVSVEQGATASPESPKLEPLPTPPSDLATIPGDDLATSSPDHICNAGNEYAY